ncbi:phosphoesterase [Halosegnis rubeus]|uniref:Phosphoesterase n=1 Tax=Halosegnis rubeus TaxID=2212850 RepID=A0A5N5UBB8_9EURY|nr:phosphoesterase [Halosegnis rubeus]
MVEPIPDVPAATAATAGERLLVFADYHAGLEVALRRDGVELRSAAEDRRARLLDIVRDTRPDRVVALGDAGNALGTPSGEEKRELRELFDAVTSYCPLVVVKGNHDGDVETVAADSEDVIVTDGTGTRIGDIGFAHGHTWPSESVLSAETLCVAHEHPQVRLEDEVGGARTERAWLRGGVNPDPFTEQSLAVDSTRLVVFPAFNDRVGGTWVNENDAFLAPFLPDALADGEAYLLDGTRLGRYDRF